MLLTDYLFLKMAGVFYELDLYVTSTRVKNGIANARTHGSQIGRKRTTINDIPEKFCPVPEVIKSENPCAAMDFRKQKRTPTFYQSKRPMVSCAADPQLSVKGDRRSLAKPLTVCCGSAICAWKRL